MRATTVGALRPYLARRWCSSCPSRRADRGNGDSGGRFPLPERHSQGDQSTMIGEQVATGTRASSASSILPGLYEVSSVREGFGTVQATTSGRHRPDRPSHVRLNRVRREIQSPASGPRST
jgi:hypothetical protein